MTTTPEKINPYLFSILKDSGQRRYITEHNNHTEKATRIMVIVADMLHVTIFDLQASTRKHKVVNARQIAMFAIRQNTNLTLKEVGYMFGGRDHSTVIYAMETVNDRKDTDKFYLHTLNRILNAL